MEPPRPVQAPPFLSYTPASLSAATKRLIAAASNVWDQVALIPPSEATFATAIQPIITEENERLTELRILQFFSSSSTSKELRDASKEAGIRFSQDAIERHSRDDVFTVIDAVSKRPDVKYLPLESRVYIEKLKKEFLANGAGLRGNPEARTRLKEANIRLVALVKQYSANLNGESGGLWLSPDELNGLSPAILERFKTKNEDGKLWVTFKTPDKVAVESHVQSMAVRRKYLDAWEGRVADANGPLLDEILRLRRETAQLLGYRNFADSKSNDRMMSTKDATDFLAVISDPLLEVGKRDVEKLSELKKVHLKELSPTNEDDGPSSASTIFRWDSRYYMNMMMAKGLKLDSEKVSEYFPFQAVLAKLFDIFSLLFGIRVDILDPASEGITTWHENVMVMSVWDSSKGDKDGEFMGYVYIDPYPREGKYGHVGQYGLQPGFLRLDGTRHYPVSCLMLNYAPPTASRPSLLHFRDVVQVFHEMGHSMHWLACRSMYARFHQNTARDFVELPSKMLEHLFYDRNIIRAVSCHYETAAKIPEALIDALVTTRYVNASLGKLSDLVFASFDMAVHTDWQPSEAEPNPSVLLDKIRREKSPLKGPEDLELEDGVIQSATRLRFLNGYAASYYSYLLSDAFSTDLFQAKFQPLLTSDKCEDWSEIINASLRAEGRRYRHAILEPGSSTGSELELIKKYLGRDPDPNTLVDILAKDS
ncbi:hypothetical protein JX265_006976 [Neoarthrinium moseri]|uniref:Peptidase M3A/M3B catalytic domain-containing protein n=1 Tax=Neoarthrinium moseri TaxID=1658444 RepID=A0A9P9WLD8_9PEZI|nr:hypothetical protein JX265_006976 [Neoarthrinium moseri]